MIDIAKRTREIIAKHLGVDEAEATDDAHLFDDLGADSLDTVELVISFEDAFGIEISDESAENIATVGDAVALVQRMKSVS